MDKKSTEEFYTKLREKLLESTNWPSDYLYKFIVPTDEKRIAQINKIFDNTGAVIESKKSKKGTYTSLSIMVHLKTPTKLSKNIRKYLW